jgi:hypothetical protein
MFYLLEKPIEPVAPQITLLTVGLFLFFRVTKKLVNLSTSRF